jgi:catechol 2,3-dioxygenase-like lactoylglutathione lyase family enzyme
MSRIRHIAVVTSNQEKLGNFYKTAFGMKEVKGIGSALYLSDGYMNLALIKKTPELKVDEGLYHFGFEVDDVEPLKIFSNRLEPRAKYNVDQKIVMLNSGFTIRMETPSILYAPGSGLYRSGAVD